MTYEQLTQLLNPEQFKQMEVVRNILRQDPTAMDKVRPENGDGRQESALQSGR